MAIQVRLVGAIAFFLLGVNSTSSLGDEVVIRMNLISAKGVGNAIGTLVIEDEHYGVTITPKLEGLRPGKHAFHIHQNPDCGPAMEKGRMVAGLKAGGHYDPTREGHKMGDHKPHGDLRELMADADGTATKPVKSNKLKVAMVRGRSIMVHRFGENEPGKPKGGGARLACGVIPK
jgi:Cu-Zn family superoxide dismutase